MSDDGPDRPLEYRNPGDDRRAVHPAVVVAAGLVVGGATPVIIGLVLLMVRNPPIFSETPHPPFRFWPETLLFGGTAIASLVLGLRLLVRRRRQFFFAGLLLGLLVMCSVEGTCFFNPG